MVTRAETGPLLKVKGLKTNVLLVVPPVLAATSAPSVCLPSRGEFQSKLAPAGAVAVTVTDRDALTMTLRNDEDVDVIEERGRATMNTLLSGERTRVLQQKRFNTIQVIRGAGVTTEPVKK